MSKETRNLLLFFVATLLSTYAAYFTIVFNGWSPYQAPGLILFLIGGSSPTWVGLLLVFFTYNREQRLNYFKRLSPRLIAGRWWAVIILLFPLVFAVAFAIEMLAGGSLPGMTQLYTLIATPSLLPLVIFLGLGSGPFSEEFGWRGIALDPLIRRFGLTLGASVMGFIWGVWHLPLFFMPQTWHGQLGFRPAGFFTFVLASIAISLVMSWIHVNTHGSILAAMMMHFFSNFTSNTLLPYSDQAEMIHMIILLGLGLAVCLGMERKSQRKMVTAQG